MSYDIFISYRRSDQAIARALVADLEKQGLSVWWDQHIEGGDDWRDAIVAGLESATALVILFSEDCNASKQLRKELAIADTLNKPIIPILIEDTQPKGHFLYELASRNWIQAFPNALGKTSEIAAKLASDLRQDGVLGGSSPLAKSAMASPSDAAQQAKADAKSAKRRAKHLAKVGMRDFLPFRWIDIPLVLLLSFSLTIWLQPEFEDRDIVQFATSYGLWIVFVISAYGAVMFPMRYYMRGRRFWRAVWNYVLSSLFLYALCFGIYWFGINFADIDNFGEAWGFLMITGIIWLIYFVVAFVFYAILSAQRAIRNFRKNVQRV